MDYNSTKNQEIKRQLVNREVITNASWMMQELRETHGDKEEYMNLLSKEDYETPVMEYIDDEMTVVEAMNFLVEAYGFVPGIGNAKQQLKEDLDCFDKHSQFAQDFDIEPHYKEALEFWIVSDCFGEKLQEKGEIVGEFMGFTIWGRCTSGQAIFLDSIILEIAFDMEILQGQKYSWSENN